MSAIFSCLEMKDMLRLQNVCGHRIATLPDARLVFFSRGLSYQAGGEPEKCVRNSKTDSRFKERYFNSLSCVSLLSRLDAGPHIAQR